MRFLALILLLTISSTYSGALRDARNLADDLHDIISLIPLEDVLEICNQHLETDGAAAAAIIYMQSEDWAKLVITISSKQQVQDLFTYLTEAGLELNSFFENLYAAIQGAKPGVDPDENGSLRSLLDDIHAAVPEKEISATIDQKLQSSADMQELYTRISSEEAKKLVEDVRNLEEMQKIDADLRRMEVQVDQVWATIYEFLGWSI